MPVSSRMPTSPIKSPQRGTVALTGAGTVNVTLSAVAMNKTSVNFNNTLTGSTNSNVYAHLTSPTNLAIVSTVGAAATAVVSWEIIEYN